MNHSRAHRITRRGVAFGIAAALVVAACGDDDDSAEDTEANAGTEAPADTEEPAETEAPADTEAPAGTEESGPCAPLGELAENTLNDRCVAVTDENGEIVQEIEWAEEDFASLGDIWTWEDGACGLHGLTAVRDQVLVAVDHGNLDNAVTNVVGQLSDLGAVQNEESSTELFRLIDLAAETDIEEVLGRLPELQGDGWSADLNYLEPLAPNNGFRPDDDPEPYEGDTPETEPTALEPPSEARVLVLDSTANEAAFDVDGNGLWDEDHGHGAFVHSIIDLLAPDAGVRLQAVESDTPRLQSGRWAPMMFADSDILAAMEAAVLQDAPYEFVNMSLGGPGCTDTQLGYGVGERVALARAMKAMAGESTVFVAAAGNHGGDIKHFPAAWVDQEAMTELAGAVTDPDVASDIEELHAYFLHEDVNGEDHQRMYAVGSVDDTDAKSDFSNCGDWVNATAYGSDQVGFYPHSEDTRWATWSGTSFATANVTAQLASGNLVAGVTLGVPELAC